MISLTEKDLSDYRAIKEEIKDLNRRIDETKRDVEIVQCGVVKGSSKHFPYTPMSFHVSGIDPEDMAGRQKEVSDLLRQREIKRGELVRKQIEIENYISNIQDPTTRTIFRMHFFDGESQIKIGKVLGYDQSIISRKIKLYIKLHKKHN